MKKRMKKVATLCLAGVTAMSTVGVTGSAVFAKGDTNYDVDNMDFENVELRVAFRFNNGSDTDGQAKWYYKALDEFNKENEGKIHVTDEITKRSLQQISLPVMYRTHSFSMAEAVQESM